MNKKITIILSLVSIMLLFCNFGFAQPLDKNLGVGARLSYYAPEDTTLYVTNKFEPDDGVLFEGNLTWFPIQWLSMEFAVGYMKTSARLKEPGLDIEVGDLEQIPLLLTGRFHWWSSDSMFTFYGGGGIGYYLNDFTPSSEFRALAPSLTTDVDDSFVFHLAAGLEWFFTESWGLNLDLKYIWNEADFDVNDPTDPPPETHTMSLDTLVIGLGIKYYF